MMTDKDPHGRRMVIIWGIAIAVMLATALWRFTGLPFPSLQLRILIVLLATGSGAVFIVRGILRGFSRTGGWKAAAAPLLIGVFGLSLGAAHLTDKTNLPLSVLGLVCILAGVVLQQREREDAGRTS